MRKLFAVVVVCFCAAPAQAALLVYEPFNYTAPQTVQGLSPALPGTPWQQAGPANPPSEITVESGNLSVPSNIRPQPSGNRAEIDGVGNGNGSAIRLALGTSFAANSGNTIWFSFPMRVDALTGSTNVVGGFFLALNNSTGVATANLTAAAARVQSRIDPVDGTKFDLGIFRNQNAAAAATSWSGALDVGQTYFIVGSYQMVPNDVTTPTTGNDIARLWINPNPITFNNNALTPAETLIANNFTSGSDIGVASVILRQSPAPHLSLDELRVGTTWASVTPTPEASSLFVFLGVALTMLCNRRRILNSALFARRDDSGDGLTKAPI